MIGNRGRLPTLLLPLMVSGTAWADLAVIVHPDSSVPTLSPRQVSDLYLGRARSLPAPDGGAPLLIYEHRAGSPVRERFYRALNGMDIRQVNAYWARLRFSGEVLPPAGLPDSQAVLEAVSRSREAVGYVDMATVSAGVRVVLRLRE